MAAKRDVGAYKRCGNLQEMLQLTRDVVASKRCGSLLKVVTYKRCGTVAYKRCGNLQEMYIM